MTIKQIDAKITLLISSNDGVLVSFACDVNKGDLIIKSEKISMSEAAVISAFLKDCADALDSEIDDGSSFEVMH